MARFKVGVVGGGNVGATVAQRVAERDLADVILTDIVEGLPQGKTLDLCQASGVDNYGVRLKGSNSVEDLKGCDVVVITAGLPRKPGMTREDLIDKNAAIVGGVAEAVRKNSPDAILVMVTNPLDIMTYLASSITRFPRNRVVGMAGVLDSARFSYFIAEKLNVSPKDIRAMVLGGHGDAMVPLPRYSTVNGVPITELMSREDIDALVKRTANGGAEIVALLKAGSAYYAPGSSVTQMVESILKDERRLLPCACILEGEYGLSKTCIGVPAILGRNGVEKVVELKLSADETALLKKSAAEVTKGLQHLKLG